MSGMMLRTQKGSFRKLRATNFATTFSTTLAKSGKTAPIVAGVITDGFVDLGADKGNLTVNALVLLFFGTNTNNNTGKVRIWGVDIEESTGSYEWTLLAELGITLGNIQGTAGCAITSSDFEADTITLTYGNARLTSPANDVRGAQAVVDTLGHGWAYIEFDTNSSATDLNCLVKKI